MIRKNKKVPPREEHNMKAEKKTKEIIWVSVLTIVFAFVFRVLLESKGETLVPYQRTVLFLLTFLNVVALLKE